jgi:flagellin
MSMTVRTNIASMQAAGQLGRTQKNLSRTLGRISSGMRITQAADDAAGLGVATALETSVISTRQAMRNANDGISIIQTAESATNEVTDILQRMRELAIQSASDTLADEERSYIQDEFLQLRQEVERIAAVTEFNGVSLTDGSSSSIDVQVGI